MKELKQNGFSLVEAVLITVVLIAVVLFGIHFYVFHNSKVTIQNENTTYTFMFPKSSPTVSNGHNGQKAARYGVFIYPRTSGLDSCPPSNSSYTVDSEASQGPVTICQAGTIIRVGLFTATNGTKQELLVIKNDTDGNFDENVVKKVLSSLTIK